MPDKTLVMQHLNSVVDSVAFYFDAQGNVVLEVTGHTTYAAGGETQPTVHRQVLPNGPTKTDALSFRANRALAFWKTQEGL